MKNKQLEQITSRNVEILENFFKEMQTIIYRGQTKRSQQKMLYSARYWANYMMQLNNTLICKHLQEKK